ncbi:META domain-containing protein [Chiayiivirga flava]|uniref:Heat shock protein HslJ n=1 Tax=Chiayiivirga flava TaxID=659595 RepID=A0A7W8D3P3_9GAMM|nr:META domain-containing protein [Chiayiivirga flava]MBB5207314.1 heat shock protein HslJ [Chiayiivirga flava]
MRASLARLALLASSLAMTACAAAPEDDNTPLALADSAWTLAGASAGPMMKGGASGTVTLAFAADRISGSGGCNRYQATYTLAGNTLTVGPVGATKIGCQDERGEIERGWFSVLGGPLTVTRAGDRLVLRDAVGVTYSLLPASAEK